MIKNTYCKNDDKKYLLYLKLENMFVIYVT